MTTRLIFLMLLISSVASGQVLRRPVAATYTSLGAYSSIHSDVFSFTANPASLAQLNKPAAGVYGERRFMLAELNNFMFAAGLPTGSGHFGLTGSYFGFTDFNETQAGLTYARNLGNKVDVGARFNYHGISISSGYGTASAVSVELGALFHVSEKLHVGIQAGNPVGGKFGKQGEEELPSVYSLGVGYDASEKFFVSTEIVKEENQPVSVNAGMQYKFLPQLLVRGGVTTGTSSAWFGLGLVLKSFRLDVTTSWHLQLGISPGLLLLYEFNKNLK